MIILIPSTILNESNAWMEQNIQHGVTDFFVPIDANYYWLSGEFSEAQTTKIKGQFAKTYETETPEEVLSTNGLVVADIEG